MEFIIELNDLIKRYNKRLDWDEYFMSLCLLISNRSTCSRLNVGCILVKDNRVISSGYNGHLPGLSHGSVVINNHEQCTIHAEQNAIVDASKRGVSLKGCVAYVTHYPCLTCMKLLIASGISEIKYLNDYKNDPLCHRFLNESNINISKI